MNITIGNQEYVWDVYVAPIIDPLLLGLGFQVDHMCKVHVDLENCTLVTPSGTVQAQLMGGTKGKDFQVSRVVIPKRVVIPPNSIKQILVQMSTQLDENKEFLVESTGENNKGVIPCSTLVKGN